MRRARICALVAVMWAAGIGMPALAAGPNFAADYVFSGSALDGWTQLGSARWQARDGEITVKASDSGGWLLLDRSFSNVGFYSEILCTGDCKGGVLLRAERTADGGMKGVYVALGDTERGTYAVTLDSAGRETSRTPLKAGTNDGGLPGAMANTPREIVEAFNRGVFKVVPLPKGVSLPALEAPSGAYRPATWNELNVILYNDALRPGVNGGPDSGALNPSGMALPASIAPPEVGRFGQIALRVDGPGSISFRNVRYKDLNVRPVPREMPNPTFERRQLDSMFTSWSATSADINRDRHVDVIAGPYIFLGPDFSQAREFYTPAVYNPASEYPQRSFVNFSHDWTGDGWPDIIALSGNAGYSTVTLYVNPQGESRHWDSHVVLKPIGNEVTLFRDIDGDGQPELIHAVDDALGYSKPDPQRPTEHWVTTVIAEKGPWGFFVGHGLGVGDVNGDGRNDFLSPFGWWEQPANASPGRLWPYHPQVFGRAGNSQGGVGGAELGVFDVNGDGLNDVVTALEGHRFGLSWFEQKRDATGKMTFVEHPVMGDFLTQNAGGVIFTEPHTTAFADIDGDGLTDIVTGKRAMSHVFNYFDADPFGLPVLYVYQAVRDPASPGGARFEPHLIHDRSGVGSSIVLDDLDGDGVLDIATSGVYGTFVFLNRMARARSGK